MSTAKSWSPLVATKKSSPSGWSTGAGTSWWAGSGLAHAVGLAVGNDDVGVVQEPVEQADRGGVFGEESAPGVEGPVAGDTEGAAFVGGGDEPEQQLRAGVVE